MLFTAGLEVKVGGAPVQKVYPCDSPGRVGLVGSDYPGLRLKPAVEIGARVRLGEPVLVDRAQAEIVVTAPATGVVEDIVIGSRRRVSSVTLRVEGTERRDFRSAEPSNRNEVRTLLLESGLWTSLLERPFGRVPQPGHTPDALFLVATDTEPNAPDPAIAMREDADALAAGAEALAALTDGPVFLCQPPGITVPKLSERMGRILAAGAHPEGLAGTLIDRHFPIVSGRTVWQMGYADVIALGALLATGTLPAERVVALSGPMAREPRLVRLPVGADIEALAATEARPGPRQTMSGSPLAGIESRFLRRRHVQVSLLPRPDPRAPTRWMPEDAYPIKRRPIVPHAALDRALGPRLPVVPLLRALSSGDASQAARLGALALLEEDVALATYLSGGAEDFATRLRDVLDHLEAQT